MHKILLKQKTILLNFNGKILKHSKDPIDSYNIELIFFSQLSDKNQKTYQLTTDSNGKFFFEKRI